MKSLKLTIFRQNYNCAAGDCSIKEFSSKQTTPSSLEGGARRKEVPGRIGEEAWRGAGRFGARTPCPDRTDGHQSHPFRRSVPIGASRGGFVSSWPPRRRCFCWPLGVLGFELKPAVE